VASQGGAPRLGPPRGGVDEPQRESTRGDDRGGVKCAILARFFCCVCGIVGTGFGAQVPKISPPVPAGGKVHTHSLTRMYTPVRFQYFLSTLRRENPLPPCSKQ
jgi:hypothetical protein